MDSRKCFQNIFNCFQNILIIIISPDHKHPVIIIKTQTKIPAVSQYLSVILYIYLKQQSTQQYTSSINQFEYIIEQKLSRIIK